VSIATVTTLASTTAVTVPRVHQHRMSVPP
jgi:hypothetical protein